MNTKLAFVCAAVALASVAVPGIAQDEAAATHPPVLMDRDAETRLALSAGPPAIARGAGVWLMTGTGFRQARTSSNGFECFVERVPTDPDVRAPQCMDAVAAEYVLPVKLEEARLHAAGHTAAEIAEAIGRGFAEGSFRPPPMAAFNYMLSAGQYLGAQAGQWNPHVMVYTPYRTNQELGGDPAHPAFPFIAFEEGRPLALTVIVTTEFVDPEGVETGR